MMNRNQFGKKAKTPNHKQLNFSAEEMGPWEQNDVPRYATLQVKPEFEQIDPSRVEKMNKKFCYNLKDYSNFNKKHLNGERKTKLPYLKNYSQKIANFNFTQKRRTLFAMDSLNFIKKKTNQSNYKQTEAKEPMQPDKSYLLKSESSSLKLQKLKELKSRRYNIYEQCLMQLKNDKGLKEKLKQQSYSFH